MFNFGAVIMSTLMFNTQGPRVHTTHCVSGA